MPAPFKSNLLRRTIAALAAAAALVAASEAQAQATVTLTGATGNSCTYSSMSVTPNGAVSVQCAGSPPPTPLPSTEPGAFSFESSALFVDPGAKPKIKVKRTGGAKGAFKVGVSPYGAACWGNPDSLDVADGAAGGEFEVTMGTTVGSTCEFWMHTVTASGATTGATVGTPDKVLVTVGSGPGPGQAPGCAAPPESMQQATFGGMGNATLHMQASGQVLSMKLPATGLGSGQITFSESPATYSPNPVTIEISINKCRGLIETDYNNFCNLKSMNGFSNSIVFLTKPYTVINNTNANVYGYCWAGDAATQYYVNARWSYASCLFGTQTCGFAINHSQGPY